MGGPYCNGSIAFALFCCSDACILSRWSVTACFRCVSGLKPRPLYFQWNQHCAWGAICLASASSTSSASAICIAWSNDRSSLSSLRCVLLLQIPQTSWSRSASPRNSPKLQVDAIRRSSAANAVIPSPSFWVRWLNLYISATVSRRGFRWLFNVSVISSNDRSAGFLGLTRLFGSIYVSAPTRVSSVATLFLSAALITAWSAPPVTAPT